MSPTRPSAPPRRGGAATRRSNARAAVCSPGSSPTRARRPPRAEYDIYKDIPAPARIDRTWDNGTESSCHLLVDESLGMLTYYADPYSSYQRGSNENRNGRIRRYLPKRTSFDDLTDADLQAIVDEINDTPMKVLDWETPNEV